MPAKSYVPAVGDVVVLRTGEVMHVLSVEESPSILMEHNDGETKWITPSQIERVVSRGKT